MVINCCSQWKNQYGIFTLLVLVTLRFVFNSNAFLISYWPPFHSSIYFVRANWAMYKLIRYDKFRNFNGHSNNSIKIITHIQCVMCICWAVFGCEEKLQRYNISIVLVMKTASYCCVSYILFYVQHIFYISRAYTHTYFAF